MAVGDANNPIRVDPVGTTVQSVTISGVVALPSGAATSALQTQPGIDIGDVTINNASGIAAVYIQDGGNSITVDGPLTDAQLRATPITISGVVVADFTTTSGLALNSTLINGTQKTRIYAAQNNVEMRATERGALRTTLPQRLFSALFEGVAIDTFLWTVANANGGTQVVADGASTFQTNGSANGTSIITSATTFGFFTGSLSSYVVALRLTTAGTVNNTRRWGVFDATNGAFFQLSGTTFSVVTRKAGVDTVVSSGSFSGDFGTSFSPTTNYTTYEIEYNAGGALFVVSRQVLHEVNGTTAPVFSTTTLPVRYENVNSSGSTTAVVMETRGVALFRHGGDTSVQGVVPAGSTIVENPVYIGGRDPINNKKRAISVSADGVLITQSLIEAIQHGIVAGRSGRVVGTVTTAATTEAAIRATTYNEPTSGTQRSISSANANDTAAGTGVRTVQIIYFTLTAGVIAGPFFEPITMNGVTPVNTVATNICYVEQIEVLTVGSGGVSAGIITMFNSTGGGGGTLGTMAAGTRRTYWCHHYVPNAQMFYLTEIHTASTAASGNTPLFGARWRDPTAGAIPGNAERELFLPVDTQGSVNALDTGFYPVGRTVPGPAVVVFYVTPTNGASQVNKLEASYYET